MLIILLIVFFFALAMSAFYSGYETGVYSMNDIRLAHRASAGSVIAKYLSEMRRNTDALIITILVGNNVVNFLASSSLAKILEMTASNRVNTALATTLILTPAVLVFGEIVPKRLFASRPSKYCYSPFLFILFRLSRALFSPVVYVLAPFQRAITRLFKLERHHATVTVSRRRLQESFGADGTALPATLGRIATRLMETMHVPARELMLPLPACTIAPVSLSVDEFISIAMTMRRSRIPVYDSDRRKPIGVVDVFSALNARKNAGSGSKTRLSDIVKPLRIIRSNLSAYEALRLMQRTREPLVAVSDDGDMIIGLLPMSALAAQIGLGS